MNTNLFACSSNSDSDEGDSPNQLARAVARMDIKTETVAVSSQQLNLHSSRVLSPQKLAFIATPEGMVPASFSGSAREGVQAYVSGDQTQALIHSDGRTLGGSVSTAVCTETSRKSEKKSTSVQYDKTKIDVEGRDFHFDPNNYRGSAHYQGGHIIDHKYSAGASHSDQRNYFPVHYFYNAPLKEYLVKRPRADAYLEIPLYSPNPPAILIKGTQRYQKIPIGVLLVIIVNRSVQDVYYFPNGSFDYQALKGWLGVKKDFAKAMVPHFRIKESLYVLLRPAILHDVRKMAGTLPLQEQAEQKSFESTDDLAYGMTLIETDRFCPDVSKLSHSVVHEGRVKLKCIYESPIPIPAESEINDMPLALMELGEFLIRYGMGNALKSEFLSISSRLTLVNVLIDFIANYHEVSDSALEFVDNLEEEFSATLKELYRVRETMGKSELLYLSDTFSRLVDPSIQDFTVQNYCIYGYEDQAKYLIQLIELIMHVRNTLISTFLEKRELFQILDLFTAAQEVLAYLSTNGYPEEYLEDSRAFMAASKDYVVGCFEEYSRQGGRGSEEYTSNLNRSTKVRSSLGWIGRNIPYMGTFHGSIYNQPDPALHILHNHV